MHNTVVRQFIIKNTGRSLPEIRIAWPIIPSQFLDQLSLHRLKK